MADAVLPERPKGAAFVVTLPGSRHWAVSFEHERYRASRKFQRRTWCLVWQVVDMGPFAREKLESPGFRTGLVDALKRQHAKHAQLSGAWGPFLGTAKCTPPDQFSRRVGRRLALAHALEPFTIGERQQCWVAYREWGKLRTVLPELPNAASAVGWQRALTCSVQHHVAATCEVVSGGMPSIRLYLDGQQVGTVELPRAVPGSCPRCGHLANAALQHAGG